MKTAKKTVLVYTIRFEVEPSADNLDKIATSLHRARMLLQEIGSTSCDGPKTARVPVQS